MKASHPYCEGVTPVPIQRKRLPVAGEPLSLYHSATEVASILHSIYAAFGKREGLGTHGKVAGTDIIDDVEVERVVREVAGTGNCLPGIRIHIHDIHSTIFGMRVATEEVIHHHRIGCRIIREGEVHAIAPIGNTEEAGSLVALIQRQSGINTREKQGISIVTGGHSRPSHRDTRIERIGAGAIGRAISLSHRQRNRVVRAKRHPGGIVFIYEGNCFWGILSIIIEENSSLCRDFNYDRYERVYTSSVVRQAHRAVKA